ncbi:MAG: response regulator transcription factor [Terriglobales bacterium]|jgi:DNA-binding NarL/FixJ family response regulator
MSGETAIRLIIADDHEVVRAGLKALISKCRDFVCVGSTANGQEAVDLAYRVRPDVALLDLTMPSCDGLEATHRLQRKLPDIKVLVYSMRADPTMVLAALRAGALGYVSKSSPPSVLMEAIHVVASGKRFVDPSLADMTLRGLLDQPLGEPAALTPRERDVLARVARGFTNNDIGTDLGLSTKTIESYRARACEKLSLPDRPAIVKFALMSGWMDQYAG